MIGHHNYNYHRIVIMRKVIIIHDEQYDVDIYKGIKLRITFKVVKIMCGYGGKGQYTKVIRRVERSVFVPLPLGTVKAMPI